MTSTMTLRPPVTPDRIMQFAWGFAPPLIIEAATKHGLFTLLDERPRTLAELAAATHASTRGLRALADALVGLGFARRVPADGGASGGASGGTSGGDRYALTEEASAFLVPGKPGYHGGFFKHVSTQLLPEWLRLTDVVRTGAPVARFNSEAEGAAFFGEFVEDIMPMSFAAAQALGRELQLSAATDEVRVLDVAAGSGVWGIALAQHGPTVRVTAQDWEGVLPTTKRIAAKFGVADRFTYVPGDLLAADFGTGHHVATLGHILHSEGEARGRQLLKKTFAALAPGGTIAIAEFTPDADRTGPAHTLLFAVNMLIHTEHGDTFSYEEICGWLADAGFTRVRQLDAPGPSPLILANRPR